MIIETTKYAGTGQLNLTGKLGEVMKESVNTSLSWIKANATRVGILQSLKKVSIDVHDDHTHHQNEKR